MTKQNLNEWTVHILLSGVLSTFGSRGNEKKITDQSELLSNNSLFGGQL